MLHLASYCRSLEWNEGATMLKDFKEFAVKGNVLDLAVGLFIDLSGAHHATLAEAKAAGAATINYGLFINSIMDFLIVAFAVFLLVRQVNKLRAPPAAAAVTTKECPYCVSLIPLKATRCPNCTSQVLLEKA